MSKEPAALKRGKEFHKLVQENWSVEAKGEVNIERSTIVFPNMRRTRQGRMDIFVDDMNGDVAIIEIKGTDWDNIRPKNVQRNLASHRRQIWKYIDRYFEDGAGVGCSSAMIYPTVPSTPGLRERIESYLNDYGLVVVWFNGGDAIIS